MTPRAGTFLSEEQRFGGWPVNHTRNETGPTPVDTSYELGSLDDRIARQVRQQTAHLEDAVLHFELRLNNLQVQQIKLWTDMNSLQVQQNKLRTDISSLHVQQNNLLSDQNNLRIQHEALEQYVLAETFWWRIQKDFLKALDAARRSILETQLGRPLEAYDDYYSLIKINGSIQLHGSPLDDALKAGETAFQQAYEAAKTVLRSMSLQVFPQALPALALRKLVCGPVTQTLERWHDTTHLLERIGPARAPFILDDIRVKIESGDPSLRTRRTSIEWFYLA
ncbi:hypothetical protein KFL_000830310 [Klebsormidium nitens]|uniref:Uncharacterized protein n=1 Tax=Klebsormidium nitens TaxID=105231 RepID=A0A1Y1HWH4_KLENI|nr:hypothetical protein KFL_000830310 [Klebsormidium nitens]|eukprot:GAQ81549.1 hypothetical protein KFL_000830310 [Klebsormidium nitens]